MPVNRNTILPMIRALYVSFFRVFIENMVLEQSKKSNSQLFSIVQGLNSNLRYLLSISVKYGLEPKYQTHSMKKKKKKEIKFLLFLGR